MNVDRLFQKALLTRGLEFSIDAVSGRYAIEVNGTQMLVGLENLKRDMALDGDADRVTRFVDSILASSSPSDGATFHRPAILVFGAERLR